MKNQKPNLFVYNMVCRWYGHEFEIRRDIVIGQKHVEITETTRCRVCKMKKTTKEKVSHGKAVRPTGSADAPGQATRRSINAVVNRIAKYGFGKKADGSGSDPGTNGSGR